MKNFYNFLSDIIPWIAWIIFMYLAYLLISPVSVRAQDADEWFLHFSSKQKAQIDTATLRQIAQLKKAYLDVKARLAAVSGHCEKQATACQDTIAQYDALRAAYEEELQLWQQRLDILEKERILERRRQRWLRLKRAVRWFTFGVTAGLLAEEL